MQQPLGLRGQRRLLLDQRHVPVSCFGVPGELERHRPEILAACREALAKARRDADFIRLDRDVFAACPSDSIDYAVMEKTAHAAVLPISDGDVIAQGCRDTLAWGNGRLVALLGLENVVVVDTDDAVLVAHKDHVQDVKG